MREIIRDGWDIIACWKPISEKPQMGKAERVAEPEIWREKAKQQSEQIQLLPQEDSELVRRLKEIDIEKITPLQAMVLLAELKARV